MLTRYVQPEDRPAVAGCEFARCRHRGVALGRSGRGRASVRQASARCDTHPGTGSPFYCIGRGSPALPCAATVSRTGHKTCARSGLHQLQTGRARRRQGLGCTRVRSTDSAAAAGIAARRSHQRDAQRRSSCGLESGIPHLHPSAARPWQLQRASAYHFVPGSGDVQFAGQRFSCASAVGHPATRAQALTCPLPRVSRRQEHCHV